MWERLLGEGERGDTFFSPINSYGNKQNKSSGNSSKKGESGGWLGHTLQKPPSCIVHQALQWNPKGKRNRGHPKITWRGSVVSEAQTLGLSWDQIETDAQDRTRWKTLMPRIEHDGRPLLMTCAPLRVKRIKKKKTFRSNT